jgi:hypothetical protein
MTAKLLGNNPRRTSTRAGSGVVRTPARKWWGAAYENLPHRVTNVS